MEHNGKYFVFIHSGYSATAKEKSLHPPQLDGARWEPLKYRGQSYQRLARFVFAGGNTETVSLVRDNIYPGLTVSGSGIPAGSVISTVTDGTHFVMDNSALVTNTAAELTLTDDHGLSFTMEGAIIHTGTTEAKRTVTHRARYDSTPQGYMRNSSTMHHRFRRENSLGARRRTYEGTLNTEATTWDTKPPFETFEIDVNTITVGTPTSIPPTRPSDIP